LLKKGYTLLERNFRIGRIGEIDIIAEKESGLIFVEVKYRKSLDYGYPSEALTNHKINKIRIVAKMYLKINKIENKEIRFDVIEILRNRREKNIYINHIENAF
jgi:putative endonuclease